MFSQRGIAMESLSYFELTEYELHFNVDNSIIAP